MGSKSSAEKVDSVVWLVRNRTCRFRSIAAGVEVRHAMIEATEKVPQ